MISFCEKLGKEITKNKMAEMAYKKVMCERKIWYKMCGIFCSVCKMTFNEVKDLKSHLKTKDHEV